MTDLIVAESKVIQKGSLNNSSLLEEWLDFAQVKPASAKAYTKAVKIFLLWLKRQGVNDTSELSRDVLKRYRDFLAPTLAEEKDNGEHSGFSAATANLYLTSCKLFITFLYTEKRLLTTNFAEHIKGFGRQNKHQKGALDASTTKKILSRFSAGAKVVAPDKASGSDATSNIINTDTETGKRNFAIYALMTCCGLRAVEVVRADICDLFTERGKTFLRVQGKGHDSKDERISVPTNVLPLIKKYLGTRQGVTENSPLFASTSNHNRGGRMTTTSISRIVKNIFRLNGIDSPRITCHSLRHTAATAMIEQGVDLRNVQQVLRHKSVCVTEIYLNDDRRYHNNGEEVAAKAFGL